MTCGIATSKAKAVRRRRILLTCVVCAALAHGGGLEPASLHAQTAQQLQQQRERQQELEREREEQQRQREEQQERQRQQQQEREEQQERQRQQQEREQEQQRQQQEQREAQERAQQQQREQQERAQQQREAEQRQQQMEREQQQRTQSQRPTPQRPEPRPEAIPEPRDPVLQTRPVHPEPIRPARMPEPAANAPRPVESRPIVGRPIVPDRQVNGFEPRPQPHLPERRPEPERGEVPVRPELPHPVYPRPILVPEHRPEPVHLDPGRRDGRPVVIERPVVVQHKDVIVERPRVMVARPSTEVILALPPPRRTVVIAPQLGVMYAAPSPTQNYAAAQARLQAAQASCAQADAYQNYVNSVIANQNNASQGMDQLLQTIANNTSDLNTQSALLGAIGQPNPINDALQQQLTAQANTYEGICQANMANAQAQVAAAEAQLPPAPVAVGGGATDGMVAPGFAPAAPQQYAAPPPIAQAASQGMITGFADPRNQKSFSGGGQSNGNGAPQPASSAATGGGKQVDNLGIPMHVTWGSAPVYKQMWVSFTFSTPALDFGGDGAFGAFVSPNEQTAIDQSGNYCAANSSKPTWCGSGNGGTWQVCRPDGKSKWVALATSSDISNWADGEVIAGDSQAEAEQGAVSNCGKQSCRLVWSQLVDCTEGISGQRGSGSSGNGGPPPSGSSGSQSGASNQPGPNSGGASTPRFKCPYKVCAGAAL